MKVLITGGCGFIGSHIASRLYKEGHEIYIIDDLSNGNIKNVSVPHKFYNLNITSSKCEELFKNNKFDAVINLAAQVDAEGDLLDYETNILGTANMLELSKKYGVKKFIFASSKEVYGNNCALPFSEEMERMPVNPYGISKDVGEYYCQKWHEIYNLNTLCLRFSSVYGPRQAGNGENKVVPILMKNILNDEEIIIFEDGGQTRDFIYVEDAADAVYKGLESDYTGVLNVSSNTEKSINELLEILKSFHEVKKIKYEECKSNDIRNSRLDNIKIIEILDWKPKYSFEEGMEKTYRWYENEHLLKEQSNNKKKELPQIEKIISPRMVPYMENLILFFIISFLTIVVLKGRYSILTSPVDFCYIYILIMAVIYGMRQALLSIVLSSALYIFSILNSGGNIITIIYEPGNLIRLCVYIIIGAFVGYAIDVNRNKLYINNLKLESLKEKYNFLEYIYNETSLVKENLESQIINSEDSFVSIYNTTKALESFKIDEIYDRAVVIMEKLLKTSKVSIYSLSKDGNYLRLKAKSKDYDVNFPYSIKAEQYEEIIAGISKEGIFVNKKLKSELPIMVAPVIDRNKTVGFIAIKQLNFEKLTLYYVNLFKVLVELISSSITKAYRYDEATARDKFYPETEIMVNEEFNSMLKDKISYKNSSGIDFTLVKIINSNYSFEEIYNIISTVIRENDLLGIGKDNFIYVILSNSDKSSSKKVLDRLMDKNLNAKIVEEVPENV